MTNCFDFLLLRLVTFPLLRFLLALLSEHMFLLSLHRPFRIIEGNFVKVFKFSASPILPYFHPTL